MTWGDEERQPGRYFSLHHRFTAWLGRVTNTVILSPNPIAIGNASEDYYFGLLKARREGKKLVVLFPFQLPGRFRLKKFDPAILYLESPLLATKFRSPASNVLSGIFTLYFVITNVLTLLLDKFFGVKSPYYYCRPLAGQDVLWRPTECQTRFDWDLARAQDWERQFSAPLNLSLPANVLARCGAERKRMGLPEDAWFVCLHVREGGYSGDWNNFRNCDIDNYRGAIDEITRRGGWVVRMGDPTMRKLPPLERVIDYPFTSSRSAMMDVYLLKECAFYLGTSSGILDTAFLLEKPVVLTNMTSWINVLPFRRGDLSIFKHVFSLTEDRFLSLKEWLERASQITRSTWLPPNSLLVENSEDEITSVVREKLDQRGDSSPTVLQREFKRVYFAGVRELSESFRFDDAEVENCNDWFRFASRMLAWQGDVSSVFLERNWLQSSKSGNAGAVRLAVGTSVV